LRGFTLAELLAVMAIIAVLAASAAPAVRAVSDARAAGLAREVARLLALARAHAVATGQPTGLLYDSGEATLALRRIAPGGSAPTTIVGALGESAEDVRIEGQFAGAAVTSFVTGDGVGSHTAVWFTYRGEPEVRDSSGASLGPFTQDAVLTVTGDRAVTVRRSTGAVER
jgi:prepilin-type N-terminal cleavage/methylation domain-containing protein